MCDWKMRAMNRCEPPALPTGVPGAGEEFSPAAPAGVGSNVPPQAWFLVSAVFHYLGPAFAVLLFPAVGVLGVAWFRISSAAAIFAPLTKPWSAIAQADARTRRLM